MLTDHLPAPHRQRAPTSIFPICRVQVLAAIVPSVIMLALPLALYQPRTAYAHGIAGNRLFPGTLSFDDPAVNDEAILPYYAQLAFPEQGSNAAQNRLNWAFARLLT